MNKTKRDWHLMALNTHRNAGGRCEVCRKNLPLGTPPAHIIPRDINDKTLDEDWNLALMAYVGLHGCVCHTKFDENRGKAYQAMLNNEYGCKLLNRILSHPRLKEYFDRRLAIWEVKEEQAERNKDV